jgi:uncharacterized protein (DUF1697 family)
MSDSINIFLQSKVSFDEVAKEIEALLSITFEFSSDIYSTRYEWADTHIAITLYTDVDYDNDRDMLFEEYQYELEIRALNFRKPKDREEHMYKTAYAVFAQLKELHKYPLMMTYDLQEKLDEYSV